MKNKIMKLGSKRRRTTLKTPKDRTACYNIIEQFLISLILVLLQKMHSSGSSTASSMMRGSSRSFVCRTRHFSSAGGASYQSPQKVGFIGLGNMGLPMCTNLAKGLGATEVLVHDKFPERIALATGEGTSSLRGNVKAAASIAQMAAECDVVFTMLFNTETTEEVYRGKQGLFQNARSSTMFIDSTTIAPPFAKALGQEGGKLGFHMLDAPVSGGVAGAAAGTLAFMCGASSQEAFESAGKPFLEKMGKNIFYCGASGTGSIAKVCNNMALSVQMISIAEAISMGVKLGMDPTLLSNVMNKSSARCWAGDVGNPCPGVLPDAPSSRDYERGFKMSLMLKDLKLAIENADKVNADVELAKHGLQYYKELAENGFSEKDFGFVYQYVHKNKKM
ncbi:unnamed protein product [Amoebophrya sp. A25]|nr:unnamed protein product [Amoebophrya sp. A25]|eukprot:GSA25T00019781001.1